MSCSNVEKTPMNKVDDKYYANFSLPNLQDEIISSDDYLDSYVLVNFWATWCAPCVKELPYFEEVNKQSNDNNTEVILVSLDFPSQIESKLKPYLKKNKIKSRVILLDDSKINTWVPKVSKQWDGGIPATLIVNASNYNFYPKPFKKEDLFAEINKVLE